VQFKLISIFTHKGKCVLVDIVASRPDTSVQVNIALHLVQKSTWSEYFCTHPTGIIIIMILPFFCWPSP